MAGRTETIWARASAEADALAFTDRDLLLRYANTHDESAFAVLVARHARMVLGICRRILPTVQDSEDACQATFLILAQKAGSGRWRPSVANWLYTTARRVSAKARRAAARRNRREGTAAVPEAIPATDHFSAIELLMILDEELERLPARYREPLVLCYLEGLSREEAATRLVVPQGTVKTRLERGRQRLEAALKRRGVEVGLALLALAVATPATAASPRSIEDILSAVDRPTPAVAALTRGAIMNATLRTTLVVVVAAAGFGFGLNAILPAAETPEPAPTVSVLTLESTATAAPVPLAVQQAEQKLLKEVATARENAIAYLKKQQKDGTWEDAVIGLLADMEGGVTGLVTLSLLEAGVPANDPAVAKAIEYLVKLEPKKTYVVSLQTQVLARADAKKHKEQIQKNVDWLIKQAIPNGEKLAGWSYPGFQNADNSNTHFAVVGLHAAAQAGAKVDPKTWVRIREFYTRSQLRDGGWGYYNHPEYGDRLSLSMTTCGLLGLTIVAKYDAKDKPPVESFEKGLKLLVQWDMLGTKSDSTTMVSVAELGRAAGKTEFKSGDKTWAWYRDGAEKLLKSQNPDGSWKGKAGIDANSILATACGLYFLGPPAKP